MHLSFVTAIFGIFAGTVDFSGIYRPIFGDIRRNFYLIEAFSGSFLSV